MDGAIQGAGGRNPCRFRAARPCTCGTHARSRGRWRNAACPHCRDGRALAFSCGSGLASRGVRSLPPAAVKDAHVALGVRGPVPRRRLAPLAAGPGGTSTSTSRQATGPRGSLDLVGPRWREGLIQSGGARALPGGRTLSALSPSSVLLCCAALCARSRRAPVAVDCGVGLPGIGKPRRHSI